MCCLNYVAHRFAVRNAYTLIDFGDFLSNAPDDRPDPFIQMLALTDVNEAHKDFVNVRLNGVDNTNDPSQALLPASEGKSSPQSDAEKKAHLLEKVLSRWPYILTGSLLLFFIGVGLCAWKCCCGRCRNKKQRAGHKSTQRTSVIQAALPLSAMKGPGPYRPLQDPAPSALPPYSSNPNFHDPYR